MPLQPQSVAVDFGQGVDTKTDQEHLVSGSLRTGTNIRFPKDGSVDKRFGSVYLAAAGACAKLVAYRDEILTFGSTGNASTYSAAKAAFVTQGQAMECVATRDHIYGGDNYALDMAYGNGVEVYVWCDAQYPTAGQVWYYVRDAVTGAEIVEPTPVVNPGRHPRVQFISSNNTFVIAWWVAGDIKARVLSSSFVLGSTTALVADNVDPIVCGAFEISATSDTLYLLYKNATNVTLAWFTSSLVATASKSLQACYTAGAFGLKATKNSFVWCSYYYTTAAGATGWLDVNCIVESSHATQASFPVNLATAATVGTTLEVRSTSVEELSTGVATILVGVGAAFQRTFCDIPVVWSDATIKYAWGTRRIYFTQPASKPFVSGSKIYAWLYDGGARLTPLTATETSAYSLVLADLQGVASTTTFIGRMATGPVAPRVASPESNVAKVAPSSVANPSASNFVTAARILRSNSGRSGIIRVNSDFAHVGRWSPAELGESLHTVPGTTYDSSSFVEIGFAHDPEDIDFISTAAGSMAAGTYWYCFCYEWIDNRGNVHRSAPSTPKSWTAGASSSVLMHLPNLSCTSKLSDQSGAGIKLVVYRTTVGGTSAGPFYQLTTSTTSPAMSFTAQYTSFTDSVADTSTNYSLAAQATLYTTGGVLDNAMPPSSSAMVTHDGRVWLVGDDKKTIWFSKAYVEGEAVAFSDDFTIPLEDGQHAVALASMDGNLIIFSRNRIYVISGTTGPNDTGSGSSMGSPRRLAVDLGCVEPRSVVLTPGGIMFQSSAGLYLLSRGLEVSYVGQPIEDILALYPTITSAVVHPTNNCVQFSAQGTTYGARLVFDYRKSVWSWDEIGTTVAGQGVRLAGECVSNGVLYSIMTTGAFAREANSTDSGAYLDNYAAGVSTWIPKTVEIGNVQLAGVQGYQRVWRCGVKARWYTDHDLTVSVANDNSSTFHQHHTWPGPVLASMTSELVQLWMSRQLCRSVRVKVADSTPTSGTIGSGRGAVFVGLSFEVGVEAGPARVKQAQRG